MTVADAAETLTFHCRRPSCRYALATFVPPNCLRLTEGGRVVPARGLRIICPRCNERTRIGNLGTGIDNNGKSCSR